MTVPGDHAGFWRRAGAHVIDTLIFLPALFLLLYLAYGSAYFSEPAHPMSYRGPLDFVITNILPLVVVVALWARYGATPGKQWMGCRIVDAASGEPPRPGRAVVRYFAYLLSALPLGLGFLWIIWDRKKQGFHDKVAGTVVIRTRGAGARNLSEPLPKEGG